MEQIVLTQEEEAAAFKDIRYRDNLEFISMLQASECSAQAQLKKVMTDAPWKITTIGEERSVPNKTQIRFLFEDEWQSLYREAGLEKQKGE